MGSVLRLQVQWEWSLGDFKPACQGQCGWPSGKGTKQDTGQNGQGQREGCRALQTIRHRRGDHRQRQKMAYF